jgi:hypothetical protein
MMIHSRPEMIHTHQTAPTQFVKANGIRFAYRRFGKSGGVHSFSTSASPVRGSGGDRWPRGDAASDPVQKLLAGIPGIRGVKCTSDHGGNWEPHNMTVGAQRKLADRREFVRSRAGV